LPRIAIFFTLEKARNGAAFIFTRLIFAASAFELFSSFMPPLPALAFFTRHDVSLSLLAA